MNNLLKLHRYLSDELRHPYSSIKLNEVDDNYVLTLDVPGFSKKDLEIKVSKGELRIKGETEYRKINKYIQLSDELNTKDAEAKLEHGVLTITFRKPEEEQPLKLQIK